ncbi:CD1871A family CXXC motif-containing protein [Peptostreptococcus faecalis]|nr:CD1871A family CXXC motif-containing protein [Peptostreptococcus faecalis]
MKNKLKSALLMLSIAFILIGFHRGEVDRVLRKATNICLECIGIG